MKARRAFPGISVSILAFLLAFGLAVIPVLAQTTVNATTTTGGNWTATSPTPTWTCTPALSPCVPNNSPSDVFDVGINGGYVTLDGSSSLKTAAINSLSIVGPYLVGQLAIEDGETLSVANNLTTSGGGGLSVDDSGSGGSTLNVGGNLTTSGSMQIGNGGTSAASTVNVAGTFDNTGGLYMIGSGAAGAPALLNVGGAAPSTLTGTYSLQGNTGGAVLNYQGGGGITQIAGAVVLLGSDAFIETSGVSGNSALTGLTTIANYSELMLNNGAPLSTTGALTNNGTLYVNNELNVGGSLENNGTLSVSPGSTLNVGEPDRQRRS